MAPVTELQVILALVLMFVPPLAGDVTVAQLGTGTTTTGAASVVKLVLAQPVALPTLL